MKSRAHRVSVIVPCCNEEDGVPLLPAKLFPALEELARSRAVELVLVDDGSRDQTWERLVELRDSDPPFAIALARHATNRGLGAALRTGRQHATGDVIVTLDADGTYPFTIVGPLVRAVESGADIATASPYHPDGGVEGVSALRLTFSRGASYCYRVLVDRHVNTWTAMVRAYRSDVLAASISDNDGFLHVAMTLVEARRRGATIVEVPAVLATRRVGQSKARVLRITRAHLRYMGRLLWLRLTGRFWIHAAHTRLEVASHG
jgi:dolichol-phosphate mannosyltransferase